MNRPFQLYPTSPVTIELKYGRKTDGFAQKLRYFKIVSRERKKDAKGVKNFAVQHDIIEQILDEWPEYQSDKNPKFPSIVPIRLLSDRAHENFSMFRGFFNKQGVLGCGAQYGNDEALRRYIDQDDVEEGIIEGNESELPYNVECSESCKWWKNGKCNLSGTLYFRLANGLRNSNALGVVRVGGTFSQRSIRSSLGLIASETGGILRNLPLQLRIHYENKRSMEDGNTYPIPFLTVEPRLAPGEFRKAVTEEINRRKEEYEVRNMSPPESIEDIKETGAIDKLNSTEAFMDDMSQKDFDAEDIDDGDQALDLDEDVEEILDGFAKNFKKIAINKCTEDGELNIEQLREFAQNNEDQRADIFEL